MDQTVLSERAGEGVLLLTINRPERRNALDDATYERLGDAICAADADDSVRVIVVTGAGGQFTAGNDISGLQALQTAESVPGISYLRRLSGVRKPLLAAIEGVAVGVGGTMLLHFDLAYAARSARFGLPFVSLGLCPEGASSYLLPKIAGSKRAAELLLLGEPFDAGQAAEAGLINQVVKDGQALPAALEQANKLAKLPADALMLTKALLKQGDASAIARVIDHEEAAFLARCRSSEAQAAFARFINKR